MDYEDMSIKSDNNMSDNVERRATYAAQYAYGRTLFLQAGKEWMSAMMALKEEDETHLCDQKAMARAHEAWEYLQIHHSKLDTLETIRTPGSYHLRTDAQILPSPKSTEHVRPQIVVYSPAESENGSIDPDEQLYYHHVSAVKWRSDDLINLGPRPSIDRSVRSAIDDDDESPEILTSLKYAERHLEILGALAHHRQEAVRYRKICMSKGINLEETTEEDTDDQTEDIYQSLVDERELGAPRIDSLITIDQDSRHVTMPRLSPADSQRISAWATNVSPTSNEQITKSSQTAQTFKAFSFMNQNGGGNGILLDDIRSKHRGGVPRSRLRLRSRSFTPLCMPPWTHGMDRPRAISLQPNRNDSCIDFHPQGRAVTDLTQLHRKSAPF
jgi:hypothetical protein